MNLLFVGNVVPDNYSIKIKNNSLAGNKFQSKLITELRANHNCDVFSFIAVSMDASNKSDLDSFNDVHNQYFYRNKNLIKDVLKFRRELKKNIHNYDAVIVYNVAYPWLGIPRMNRGGKSALILADFSDSKSYKNLFFKCYAKICKKDIRNYDCVIGLSKKTKLFLKPMQKFLLMPGGIDINDYKGVSPTKKDNVVKLMYSGNLAKVTGVDLLIDAVRQINRNDFKLIITGRGELEEKLNNINDERIEYHGSVPYGEYLILLNSANILINPRNMNLPENQNNFPSKVFDYLAVGKVVISTKFIDYENFSENFIFCSSDVNDIKEKIEKAITEYDQIYKRVFDTNIKKAKEYSWKKQVKKIINIIEEV